MTRAGSRRPWILHSVSLCPGSEEFAFCSCLHQTSERPEMSIVPLEHQLWVPLHAKYVGLRAHHYCFNQPIRRIGHWHQIGGQIADCLVVERVYAESTVPENWQWSRIDREHLVANCPIFQAPFVLSMPYVRGTRVLGGDILNESSS